MAANGKRGGSDGETGERDTTSNGKHSPATEPKAGSDPLALTPAEGKRPGEAHPATPEDASETEARDASSPPGAESARPPAPATAASSRANPAQARQGARWAEPIARFEARWTWLESRLLTFVLLWQLAALSAWVFLNGLSESVTESAGVVFRAGAGGIVLGLAAWSIGRRLAADRRRAAALIAASAGVGLTLAFRSFALAAQRPGAGSFALALAGLDRAILDYFANLKGWLQEGSTLTLMGGLRGLGTRLTLWLALLGGSLATAAGKHIHIDVVFRFLPRRLRASAAIVNYVAAAMVCFAGVWGFFDHLAIEAYGARADDARGKKIADTMHGVSDHLFFTRKQLGLDLRSLPHVLKGDRYDRWMTAAEWNEWVAGAGFEERFKREEVETLKVSADAPAHAPLVLSPAGETTRGMLVHTLSLVFPVGLLFIGLRFLLRAILTASGHLSTDPDVPHKEDLKRADPLGEGGA